jgi:cytochrome b561
MLIKNTENHFGAVSIFLHWLMTILIIVLIVLGLYMTRIPISVEKIKLYGWHKEVGVLVLAFVVIRLLWRLLNKTPSLAALPPWEIIAARSVHYIFYILMFILPFTGWLLSSAAGLQISFFGLFNLPNLIAPNNHLRLFFTETHKLLAYLIIVMLCLHTSAALKHHLVNKDNILRRMLWP